MNKIEDANQAFLTKIQVLYDIEKQLEKALPKLEKAANDKELKDGLTAHIIETADHITRLERIFEILDSSPKKLESMGIRGIIEDSRSVIKYKAQNEIKDAMLASSARYAEHYEIAGYMSAILEADALGLADVSILLGETLAEEKMADEKLAEVIENNFSNSD